MIYTKLAKIDKNTRNVLSQALNREKSKTNLANFPIMLKEVPENLDAQLLQDCWNYFKSTTKILKLSRGSLSSNANRMIKQGKGNSIVFFYLTHLKPVFEIFLTAIKLLESQIGNCTSVTMRVTFNRRKSDQFIVTIVPKGRWWVLKVPTENNKMEDWFTKLIGMNVLGYCCMIEIYSVIHPEKSLKNVRT